MKFLKSQSFLSMPIEFSLSLYEPTVSYSEDEDVCIPSTEALTKD